MLGRCSRPSSVDADTAGFLFICPMLTKSPPKSFRGVLVSVNLKLDKLPALDRRVSIAPMMDRTDRHDRYFLRDSPSVLLYTEMITTGAILRGDRERFLKFDASEHPVALQLGGADAGDLAQCAEIAAGTDMTRSPERGLPGDRVQNMGACLMKEPGRRRGREGHAAGRRPAGDRQEQYRGRRPWDSWDDFVRFIETVAA